MKKCVFKVNIMLFLFACCVAARGGKRYGPPVRLENFAPVTAQTLNGTVVHRSIGMPEENGVEPFDFLTDIIPGGYRPSDCECYPCASTDGFPSANSENGDLALFQKLAEKVARQEKKIKRLRRDNRELKKKVL